MQLAILGLGSMGRKHAANARALGHAVIGFDPDHEARAALATSGGQACESQAEALAACDAVVIASPPRFHLRQIEAALAAGCHVLVEKPVADRIEDLPQLVDRSRGQGLIFAVAQNLRYHPAVTAARDILVAHGIGRVLAASAIGVSPLVDWRPGSDHRANYAADPLSGGVIFDWVHEIDMLAWLLGPISAAGAVAENSGTLGIQAEETAGLLLRHKGGAVSSLMLSYLGRPARRGTEIFGEAGRLEIDIPARHLRHWDAHGAMCRDESFGGRHADDYVSELEAFCSAIGGGEPPRCMAGEATEILQQVLRLRQQAGLPLAGGEAGKTS